MQAPHSEQANAHITGVILAGGKGRRLGGKDKGLLAHQGRLFIELILETIKPQVHNVFINANRNQLAYRHFAPVISDQLSDYQGPLAGMHTAMLASDREWILTVPCDAMTPCPEMAQRLLRSALDNNAEIAVAHDGSRLQPVHALIKCNLLESLQAYLDNGDRKIDRWYAQHTMITVPFSDHPKMFNNINTVEQQTLLGAK